MGAGNGGMMKVLVNTFDKFPIFKNSCHIKILERSKLLKKKQKASINKKNIQWLNDLSQLDNLPCIFLANEFFDALPIKQFIKKEKKWFERHVRKKRAPKCPSFFGSNLEIHTYFKVVESTIKS